MDRTHLAETYAEKDYVIPPAGDSGDKRVSSISASDSDSISASGCAQDCQAQTLRSQGLTVRGQAQTPHSQTLHSQTLCSQTLRSQALTQDHNAVPAPTSDAGGRRHGCMP